ncbi:nitrogenase cofactor biosynthesis protein NifB [Roseospira visakhapatnamensis]|uniref:FeMo cofactor biosynthesis protein NifB n=1 Tax=Roseospira visakhapatnamensis TaxID=390880 RepID=A0A7W6RCN2_9PROT|nr:nitrogenase cofactor biosynthesis protein NifB [Roseospira visakhapatnamensis]MBB4265950.1 nitrogen fixation protein NifB [Roseospira visakhapatnamensis]
MSSLPRVPLDALTTLATAEDLRAALARPATPSTPPGTRPGVRSGRVPHNKRREAGGATDAAVWERIKDHPCYSEDAHHDFARMHVAVAPVCNIQCHYCNRKHDCANESRPGVTSARLTPEQAVRRVLTVAAQVPQLSVVGVAGPGDALYDAERTLRTFELLRAEMPDLTLCVSTNGLALPDRVAALKALDVDHVTVTINFMDPEIGAAIHPWIFHDHRRWTGREAARILHERQMEGLEAAVAAGMLVKVNSVLIPGINDAHLIEVNQAVRAKGAFLHNVMPLISDPAHGTHFGLTGQRGPTPAEVHRAREALGEDARLMRHCRQCRADAVGMLGEDRCQDVTLDPVDDVAPRPDPEVRAAYRAVVDSARAERAAAAARADALVEAVAAGTEAPRLVAVCSRGGGRVNLHFGKATEFHVYQVDGAGIRFSGVRRADNYCLGGRGDADRLGTILTVLEGVDAVVCVKIGDGPRRRLEAAGLAVHEDGRHEVIETVIAAWLADEAAAPVRARA